MGDALIIFGVAGVGKSTVARHCALEWPAKRLVDIATVREVLRARHPQLNYSTYDVWRLAGDVLTPDNLVRGFDLYTEILWPTLTQVLQRSADDGSTLVMEGAMMSPMLVSTFHEAGLKLHPRMLYLADDAAHLNRLNNSVPEGSGIQTRLVESFPTVRTLQDHMARECERFEVPVIENASLSATVDAIIDSLPSQTIAHADRRTSR